MSDRSFCTFKVRSTDQERVEDIWWSPEYIETDGGFAEFQYPELTGGGYELAHQLREARIPYIHTWEGLVGSYPPGVAVFDGANLTEFSAIEGQPAITCQPDGTLNDDVVAEFRAKLTDYRAVLALIEGE